MNVCFFGSYNRYYSRNIIFLNALETSGIRVIHIQNTRKYFFIRYVYLLIQYLKVAKYVSVIFVAFPGHLDIPLAWFIAKVTHKKLIFDPYISLYETYVFDRERYPPISIFGQLYWWIDKISLWLPDIIITDTKAHGEYYQKTFRITKSKFNRVFVSAERVFKPSKKDKKIIIEFHGYFTKLQGAEYFLQAAKKLEDKENIEFWLIGKSIGTTRILDQIRKLSPKTLISFKDMQLKSLAKKISKAHITVGHLGTTEKALNVISNKTFHGLASKNAVIAINSKANKELFKNRENAILVEPGNVDDLVKSMCILVDNNGLREKIAANGYMLFKEKLSPQRLGKQLKTIINSF